MIMVRIIRGVKKQSSNLLPLNKNSINSFLLQFISRKSQLVKNYIFNEDDFNKMLIQEEEEDKKNQANKKEKLK